MIVNLIIFSFVIARIGCRAPEIQLKYTSCLTKSILPLFYSILHTNIFISPEVSVYVLYVCTYKLHTCIMVENSVLLIFYTSFCGVFL